MNRRAFVGGCFGALLIGALRQHLFAQPSETTAPDPHPLLVAAVASRRLIRFSYKGHARVVQPHLYGRTSTGENAVSGYQVEGGSESGDKPSWRLFLRSSMEDLRMLESTFTPRPDFTSNTRTRWREIFATVPTSTPPPR